MFHGSLYRSLRGVGVLLMLAALVVAGCSTLSNPVSPTLHTPSVIRSESFVPVSFDQAATLSREALQKPIVVTETITPDGGSISLSRTLRNASWEITLDFPSGALTETTDISIRSNNNRLVFYFGPDGIQFNKPVEVTITVHCGPGVDPERRLRALGFYYWNESEHQWERLENFEVSIDGQDILVTGSLSHFSQYALGGY